MMREQCRVEVQGNYIYMKGKDSFPLDACWVLWPSGSLCYIISDLVNLAQFTAVFPLSLINPPPC